MGSLVDQGTVLGISGKAIDGGRQELVDSNGQSDDKMRKQFLTYGAIYLQEAVDIVDAERKPVIRLVDGDGDFER